MRAAEGRGRRVVAVVASAGSTATGAYDPLEAIADFASAHGLWLHVDGAHGACAALSTAARGVVRGIERADSVVWDAHKMMLLPSLVSAVLFKDGARSYEAFRPTGASYLFSDGDVAPWYDVGERTLECTKRMMSLGLYAAITLLGDAFFEEYVDRAFALARALAAKVDAAPDFELAVAPEANIVCFRHRPHGLVPGPALDRHQSAVREAIVRSGAYYLVQTRLGARGVFLRVTLVNPRTTEADLGGLLDAVRQVSCP
jgi:L-2,4-diaminobutyrate decarboxylase